MYKRQVLINGNYGTGFSGNTANFQEHIGGLVHGGWYANAISTADTYFYDAAETRPNMRIEQRTNGDIVFGQGDLGVLMVGAGAPPISEALGSLTSGNGQDAFHQNGNSLEAQAFGMVASRNLAEFDTDSKLIVVGTSDPDLNGGFGNNGAGLAGFYKDGVIASGCAVGDVAFVDPSNSVQLAYPNLKHTGNAALPYIKFYSDRGKHDGGLLGLYEARLYTHLEIKVTSTPRP